MTTNYCSPECQKMHWPSHKTICHHTSAKISAAKVPGPGVIDESLVTSLRKFCSSHQSLLEWTGFQALQLKRIPSNIRQNALLVELTYRPTASSSLRRFSIKNTHIVPRTQVMPVEVDSPSRISWDSRDDWGDVLRHFVDSGRTDFKPISTTSRGCVYG
ncbi:hypothetical protein A0H81_13765 [Grifola frondosa]|uniref:ZMYND11/ZMYD8 MYND zinc finger domain-containing protein n=1 Tax=Grifola frondosa TaxID=5627 RepID=A0A1C7LNC1_GRIFR|nr:hypothetical protein A0H81_13765 [Grifola frondosa]